jgi:hypothetical protein
VLECSARAEASLGITANIHFYFLTGTRGEGQLIILEYCIQYEDAEMESNAVALLRKIESIKAHASKVFEDFEQFERQELECKSNLYHMVSVLNGILEQEAGRIIETRMILKEYYGSSSDVYSLTKTILPNLANPSNIQEAKGVLHQMCIECDRVIGFLNASIVPLSPQDADRLNKLRTELLDVTAELDIEYEKNVSEAINEEEKGHCLASALITSRVINHVLDQIKGKYVEDKVDFLREQNIIPKGKEGEDDKAFILKASKKARNVFSHNIAVFANPSDSLGLLGDCVKLLRILAQLKKQTA